MTSSAAQSGPPAVSIIVPVYNVAPFLEECLLSIDQQTLDLPLEVILIDDASDDGSDELCRAHCEARGEHWIFLRQEYNQGVSAARNRGLERASGEFFMCVDPDDLLPAESVERLYRAALDSGACIVKGNNTIFDLSSCKSARYNVERSQLIHGEAVLTTLFKHEKVRGHAGGKLFRREPLGHFRFPVGIAMVEDLYYCCEVFSAAKSLYLLSRDVYAYRYRESGASGQKFENDTYLEWLDTVEKTGKFAVTPAQRRAYRSLLVRTLTQAARECRHLPPPLAAKVLPVLLEKKRRWQIDRAGLLLRDRLGVRTLSRYFKLGQALRQTQKRLQSQA